MQNTPGHKNINRCRHCGKFTKRLKGRRSSGCRKYCDPYCYGLGQRGKSRDDRTSPSKKEYIQIRHEDGTREYWHRYVYRMEHGDIPEGFVVHHKTENKRENDIENLATMPANEHTPNAHFHWRERDWQSRDEYIPLDDRDDDIPF